jgi:hypothetical protein
MRKLMAIAFGVSALLVLSMSASAAQSGIDGARKQSWHYGPATCVHVRLFRSRQTRYAGAPRCRRIFASA